MKTVWYQLNGEGELLSEYLFGAICFSRDWGGWERPDAVAKWIIKRR